MNFIDLILIKMKLLWVILFNDIKIKVNLIQNVYIFKYYL